MQSKTASILVIGMLVLLAIMPASAYDYRGVPKVGDNNPDNFVQEEITPDDATNLGTIDLSGILNSPEISNLIMLILGFLLQLFGLSPA